MISTVLVLYVAATGELIRMPRPSDQYATRSLCERMGSLEATMLSGQQRRNIKAICLPPDQAERLYDLRIEAPPGR